MVCASLGLYACKLMRSKPNRFRVGFVVCGASSVCFGTGPCARGGFKTSGATRSVGGIRGKCGKLILNSVTPELIRDFNRVRDMRKRHGA